jgi:TonB-dependent SusC/RagA subfamily outer membrane receptor
MTDLTTRPITTFDDAIMGKASGVMVTKADGAPGGGIRVRIRGGSSLQRGVDPLYIIDGIPTEINNDYIAASSDLSYMYTATGSNDIEATGEAYTRSLNSLAGLNPNDIESMTILKDASATAIYGSKAANQARQPEHKASDQFQLQLRLRYPASGAGVDRRPVHRSIQDGYRELPREPGGQQRVCQFL